MRSSLRRRDFTSNNSAGVHCVRVIDCAHVEFTQQMQGQFIFALLLGHAGHQQAQQPFVFCGVGARAGLQPVKCGIQTVSVRFLQRFRLKGQNVVISSLAALTGSSRQPDISSSTL
jgi:hypothetical protein